MSCFRILTFFFYAWIGVESVEVTDDGVNESCTIEEKIKDTDFEREDVLDSDQSSSKLNDSAGYQSELEGVTPPTCLLQVSGSWFMHEMAQLWLIQNGVMKMIIIDHN
jgi:hypothetical protein